MATTTKLHGHTETVLSIAVTADPSPKIVSGAEEGELRVWSLDGTAIHQQTVEDKSDITSVVCSQQRPQLFYAACGSRILTFDARDLSTPVSEFAVNEDEINQIALSNNEDFLAACDDTGHVKIISLFDKKVFKTLRKHTNICATVAFCPSKPWTLYTGGYDSKLIQWDFSKPRCLCIIDMEDIGTSNQDEAAYLVNPPFVHSSAVCQDGNFLACGTEKAQVQIFKLGRNKNPAFIDTLHGHTQGVSQVHFPKFMSNHLVSGGNDGKILLWNLDNTAAKSPLVNGAAHANGGGSSQGADNTANITHPVKEINHGSKLNWVTTGVQGNQKFLVVADNTEVLTLYPYPEL